ncbi:regulator of telomere elongation helicase 1-like [Saccostrea echinata]|uniref:regulator of telomere elongation helicase 1-like n=1 Tax=Saccostrea echinata TaxID=191078 RepID=UPI002A82670E|nr:regulator of telomere elongation helicase 1-like [Saccostrea echinata]
MPLIDVKGVHVNFPFEPYPCQVTYMEKVIECLQKNVNGILESPTGTGKTLCLLCSSLAWLQDKKAQVELNRQANISSLMGDNGSLQNNQIEALKKSLESSTGMTWGGSEFAVPKIIYASRTHSQLTQAVQELKRSAYNMVKVSVIGSREQLCIHEHVRKEMSNAAKVHMCRAKVAGRTCFYFNHFEEIKRNSDPRQLVGDVVDIEDMVRFGEKQRVCPYYIAKELKNDADIIFMPYNYLLDAKSRKAHGVEVQGSIVIFDEAHNLEKICEDSSSFDLTSADLATVLEELSRLADKLFELAKNEETSLVEMTDSSAIPEPEFTLEDVLRLKATFKELEEEIDKIEIPNKEKGVTKPGTFIFELLSKVNIAFETKNFLLDLLDKIISYVTGDSTGMGFHSKGAGLTKMSDVLRIVFSREVPDGGSVYQLQQMLAKSYKVHIQPVQPNKKKKIDSWATPAGADKMGKTLSYWCFSPGHSMLDLTAHGVKCVILTSGTLSPLDSFSAEMQIPFPVTLENPHVIDRHQVWVGTLNKGPDGVGLNSNYQTRFNENYQASLGKALVNFARVVPNGLLVFFPSYPVMEKCIENWHQNGVYNSITQYKPILVEPRGKQAFSDVIEEFYDKINDPALNGAIFVAVCRGKVSEGLDFADNNGRAVIITGLPFPPRMDPKVVLKMQFLDESRGKMGFKSLSGQEWYRQQASRAVNQAVGRVIRHRNDYGAILLCDERFAGESAIRQLPVWVRPHVSKYDVFGRALRDMIVFFKTAEQTLPTPAKKQYGAGGSVGSSGCQGAHFMPTVNRMGPPPSQAKARSVAEHVPSLRQSADEETNLAKLKIQYEGGPSSNSGGLSKKNLLDALSSSEKEGDLYDEVDKSVSKTTKTEMKKLPSKKKIIIKKRDSDSESSQTKGQSSSVVEANPAVTNSHLQSAESYIMEVKCCLSKESYMAFSKALGLYKKTGELSQAVGVMAGLFTEDPKQYHLFRKFYRFVRHKDKKEFDSLCKELTGEGCGYKPEDSVPKKRAQSEASNVSEQPEKKQKTEFSGSVLQPKTLSNVHQSDTSSKKFMTGDLSSLKFNNKSSDGAQSVKCEDNHEIQNCKQSTGESISERLKNVAGPLDIRSPSQDKSGYVCCKCQSEAKVPFQSTCDHVCCFKCWKEVFNNLDKTCPGCGNRVRRRNLKRLLFPGPANDDQG